MRRYFLIAIFSSILCSHLFSQDSNPFRDFLVQKIMQESFTHDAEKQIRQYAVKFVELYNAGCLFKVFSIDPLNQKYTIDYNNMPANLRNYNWDGSSVAIKRNVFGQFTAGDENKFNSIIASWTMEYMRNNSWEDRSTSSEKDPIFYPELFRFIARESYGNNIELAKSKWREIKDTHERKIKIIYYSKLETSGYLDHANQNKDRFNYIDLDKVKNLQSALYSNDWNKIEEAANKFGWSFDTYLFY